MIKSQKITISLPREIVENIRQYAKLNGQSVSGLIKVSVLEKIKK
ncbi:MAG: DUF6364 family protein [Candidatus Nanoarchaeia archaeon]